MAKAEIFRIGTDIPGDDLKYVSFNSSQSLLEFVAIQDAFASRVGLQVEFMPLAGMGIQVQLKCDFVRTEGPLRLNTSACHRFTTLWMALIAILLVFFQGFC